LENKIITAHYIIETKGRKSRRNPNPEFSHNPHGMFGGTFPTREAAELAIEKSGYGADGGTARVVLVIPDPTEAELAWEREESRRDKAGDFDTAHAE